MEITPPDDLLAIGEAARRLGVSVGTLRRWTDEGRVACIRTLGGQRRYARTAIEALRAPAEAS